MTAGLKTIREPLAVHDGLSIKLRNQLFHYLKKHAPEVRLTKKDIDIYLLIRSRTDISGRCPHITDRGLSVALGHPNYRNNATNTKRLMDAKLIKQVVFDTTMNRRMQIRTCHWQVMSLHENTTCDGATKFSEAFDETYPTVVIPDGVRAVDTVTRPHYANDPTLSPMEQLTALDGRLNRLERDIPTDVGSRLAKAELRLRALDATFETVKALIEDVSNRLFGHMNELAGRMKVRYDGLQDVLLCVLSGHKHQPSLLGRGDVDKDDLARIIKVQPDSENETKTGGQDGKP